MDAQHALPFPLPANDGFALPRPSDRVIRGYVGARNFDKAVVYHAWGAVFRGRREGPVIHARCEGSGHEVYRVRVAFDAQALVSAHCSCPVGDEGRCKHVGATLLAWSHRPDEFVPTGSLSQTVERLSLTQLRALVLRLLAIDPTFAPSIEALLPEALDAHREATPRGAILQRASEIFRRRSDTAASGAGRAAAIAGELRALAVEGLHRVGDDRAAQAQVHAQLAEAVLGRWRKFGDEGATLLQFARAEIEALGESLGALSEADPGRLAGLRALMTLYRFDIEQGPAMGPLASPGALSLRVFTEVATEAERRQFAALLTDLVERSDDWSRVCWSRARLTLEEGLVDDAEWFAACEAAGRWGLVAQRHARRGDAALALSAFEQTPGYELIETAERLAGLGLGDAVEASLGARTERLAEATRAAVGQWLKARAAARNDAEASLEVDVSLFRAHPSREGYDNLKQRSEAHGLWAALRPRLHEALAERGHPLAVEVLLSEGAPLAAAEAVAQMTGRGQSLITLRNQVLDALGGEAPALQLTLLEAQCEQLAATGGRNAYREVARAMARRESLRATLGAGDEDGWAVAFRARHARRAALVAELDLHFGVARTG